MPTTVAEIDAHGGPWPEDWETKEEYYARVEAWANSMGYPITFDDAGYPTIDFSEGTETMSDKGAIILASVLFLGVGLAVILGKGKHS
jgi:hypothetical protein